jgi:hypothetical protein
MVVETINAEMERIEAETMEKEAQLRELKREREVMSERVQVSQLSEHLKLALRKFEAGNSEIKKRIIQAIVPSVVVHQDNRLELKINPLFFDSICKSGGREFDQDKIGSAQDGRIFCLAFALLKSNQLLPHFISPVISGSYLIMRKTGKIFLIISVWGADTFNVGQV